MKQRGNETVLETKARKRSNEEMNLLKENKNFKVNNLPI